MDAGFMKNRRKISESVQFKFVLTFLLLIAALLGLMNTYPLLVSRDIVFAEKESSLITQASVISSSLSVLDTLGPEAVNQVMDLLDVSGPTRILVTDETGRVVYDTKSPAQLGKLALFSELMRALGGEQVFWSRFAEGTFESRAALPVMNSGVTLGGVYISEYDKNQAELILSIQSQLRTISIAACAVAFALTVLFSRALTSRIRQLAEAIQVVRGGDYAHRLEPTGNDELTELGEEFNNLTERLETTEEQRRRFVSDASHELKTPLAAIRLLADSINQSADMDESTMREFVSDIGTESDRLTRTTEKLLDLSRRDDGVQTPRTAVDVGRVARATLRLLRPLSAKMNVSLFCEPEPGCFILASEDEVYQLIFNLVENAIKYNVDGGSVRITVDKTDRHVGLKVSDSGIGIPDADLPNIFSRFYRVDKARSREKGGSGLGLSIVHDAVTALGGSIEVSQLEPQGSLFSLTFPAATNSGEDKV